MVDGNKFGEFTYFTSRGAGIIDYVLTLNFLVLIFYVNSCPERDNQPVMLQLKIFNKLQRTIDN